MFGTSRNIEIPEKQKNDMISTLLMWVQWFMLRIDGWATYIQCNTVAALNVCL